jgi:hypothetical protein
MVQGWRYRVCPLQAHSGGATLKLMCGHRMKYFEFKVKSPIDLSQILDSPKIRRIPHFSVGCKDVESTVDCWSETKRHQSLASTWCCDHLNGMKTWGGTTRWSIIWNSLAMNQNFPGKRLPMKFHRNWYQTCYNSAEEEVYHIYIKKNWQWPIAVTAKHKNVQTRNEQIV